MLRIAFLTAIAGLILIAPWSPATAQTSGSGTPKYVWCVAIKGSDRYYSRVGEIRGYDSSKTVAAYSAVLERIGVKTTNLWCHWEPTSQQINKFKNWSLTAKMVPPLMWHEVDWTPR